MTATSAPNGFVITSADRALNADRIPQLELVVGVPPLILCTSLPLALKATLALGVGLLAEPAYLVPARYAMVVDVLAVPTLAAHGCRRIALGASGDIKSIGLRHLE